MTKVPALGAARPWVARPACWFAWYRTTLLITHDLDGLDQMDEIVVLDHGRVAERGTHAELVRPGDAQQRLWKAFR